MKTLVFISMFLCNILYSQQNQDSLKISEKQKIDSTFFKNAISHEVLIGGESGERAQFSNINFERALSSNISITTYFAYPALLSESNNDAPSLSMTANMQFDPGDVKFELGVGGGFFFHNIIYTGKDIGDTYREQMILKMPFARLNAGFLIRRSPDSNILTKRWGFGTTMRANCSSLILLGESNLYFVPMFGLNFGVSF